MGSYGTLSSGSAVRVLTAMRLEDTAFVDLGAGDGRMLLAAASMGASSALGYELPENKGHLYVFDAMRKTTDRKVSLVLEDFGKMRWTDESPLSVYSFWNGMPPETQMHVLRIAATAPNLHALSVSRDRNWTTPEQVVEAFSSFGGGRRIALVAETPFTTVGGARRTMWVFAPVPEV